MAKCSSIVHRTYRTSCHGKPYFFEKFTIVTTFYWLFGNIWPSWIRNKSYFWKKTLVKLWRKKIQIFRIQYMATWCDGIFDVNMTSSKVVRTRHHIRRFLRRSMGLKIKLNTGQTFDISDKIERRKNMTKSEGPNSYCNIEIFL